MEGLEEKLSAMLANPDLMRQIMTMAQSLGSAQADKPAEPPCPAPREPAIDPAMLQKMLPLIQGSGIDSNQQTLLCALEPYLAQERLRRLERAMRAAKLAGIAASFLGGGRHV